MRDKIYVVVLFKIHTTHMRMNTLDWIARILVIIGGLNWGLVGAADLNLVEMIFGAGNMIGDIVYILVGISALYMLFNMFMKK